MTLDEYSEAAKKIYAEQQDIAQAMSQLALSAKAMPPNPEFLELMTRQWGLVQQIASLNTQLAMGVMAPKK
ncbi:MULTISPECIES: hypothetical protein [unclassified Variovorax]|uniref:hypothetical protein n=1 Tax=unclassified Variovorax TaxID=663243 RepID=UPI00076C7271|nr:MULTISPECIES: hypothetical protein [unclassified Variovorax]KWT98109.1 hypothetical protein APY03_0780 [Variovorax sp. WDL1]PNG50415.1 hypothetical protein CHC06_06039 [Variovorax sp. B2]PNG51288.1 hypothetical protein CHC07_05945 [Variovorax sp. B4]VTU43234.1 hypothetical protein SRS16P1_00471 [Variovorax sp. SRS16]VTU43258.1 hypothetical protein E5P1_00468 [Variovorax sp. PBL-E5]